MAKSIFLLVEGPADHRTVTCLADRVLVSKSNDPDVLEQGTASPWLDHIRSWNGIVKETSFTRWREVKELAVTHNVRILGGKSERGLDKDKFRKALQLAEKMRGDRPRWMLVSRDLDNDAPQERQKSLMEVHEEYRAKGWTIVLALARPFREAWVLNGFHPQNNKEKALLQKERAELGFDPTLYPERLNAQSPGAKNNAKRVHSALCESSDSIQERELHCLENSPLKDLCSRGKGSGLTRFLEDVEAILVPLLIP